MSATNDKLIFKLCSDPNYRIQIDGTIRTLIQQNGKVGKTWRLAGDTHEGDYRRIKYKGRALAINRIIWAKFRGYLRADLVVNHLDGDKSNNCLGNLELTTESFNQQHAYRALGRLPNRGNARLPWKTVDKIRADRAAGMKFGALIKKYDLPKSTLSQIINFKTYKPETRNGANQS